MGEEILVKDKTTIKFLLGNGESIRAVLRRGQLHLMGSGGLVVRAEVSNVLWVDSEQMFKHIQEGA